MGNGGKHFIPGGDGHSHGYVNVRSCVLIGFASQWWARTRRPKWFKAKNYLLSAALDGGSQVILFILVSVLCMIILIMVSSRRPEFRSLWRKWERHFIPQLVGYFFLTISHTHCPDIWYQVGKPVKSFRR